MDKKSNFNAIIKKYFRKDEVFLLPNILCYARIIMIIIFLCFYLIPFSIDGNDKAYVYLATGVMVVAAYTDFLDGFIARKFNEKSHLGQILDPIADKLLQFAVATALCVKFWQFGSVWTMFTIFVVKELGLMVADIVLARRNKTFGGAKWYGKVSTFIFYIVLGALLIGGPFAIDAYYTTDLFQCHLIIDSLCSVAIFFLVVAAILYGVLFLQTLKHGQDEIPTDINKENK
ncbi:MAG: CDP-alcohol phosphatidyltransferase family protein [Bacilli bacterium]|jgi:cardiolipin synthase